MAKFTFNWSVPLTYPYIQVNGVVLVAEPGETYELDVAPDERFAASANSDKLAKPDLTKVVEADSEPSEGDPSVS